MKATSRHPSCHRPVTKHCRTVIGARNTVKPEQMWSPIRCTLRLRFTSKVRRGKTWMILQPIPARGEIGRATQYVTVAPKCEQRDPIATRSRARRISTSRTRQQDAGPLRLAETMPHEINMDTRTRATTVSCQDEYTY